MDEMPNAGEIIERLARENERQRIEIEQLKQNQRNAARAAESEDHMSYYIRSLEQARAIITAYERCSSCDACPLHTPEGWRCSYLHDCATRYIKRHAEDGEKTE